jgi:hypothetical protein
MAKQQTRTSGGAYQNPIEGIVDYGAFGRGIEKGIKPGLDFLKAEEKRKKEEEEKEVARKKALGVERTKLAGEIEDAEVAAGTIFGNTLNLDSNTSQYYKDWATNTRSEILNPKTNDARVKELQTQWSNIKAANGSLQYLIDIDNDPEVYDGEASDINTLFKSQGTSFKNFVEAYNKGEAKPVVKTIKGVNVGGFTMNVGGKEIFLDFENKINKTTIDSKSSFNAKASMQKISAEFNDQSKGSFENTQEYMNAKGDIVKLTNIATQYTKGVDTLATTEAREYLGKNPGLNASIFSSALRQTKLLKSSLTEEELAVLKATGSKYINYNKKAVVALVGIEKTKALASGAPISDSLAEGIVNDNIDALRNKINNIYVKNEFLKQNENFSLNPETGVAEPRGPQTDVKLDKGSGSGKTENETVDLLEKQIKEVPEDITYPSTRTSQNIPMTTRSDVNITKLLNATATNESSFQTNKEFKSFFFELKRNEGIEEDEIKKQYNIKILENKGSNIWLKKGDVYTGLDVNSKEKLIEAMVNAVDYAGMNKQIIQNKLKDKFGIKTGDKYVRNPLTANQE